jgi:hypothetical protein
MSKKTLYLHIGMGKTGTTALQDFFWANRKTLAEDGVSYPDLGVQSGAHHLLSPRVPPFLKNIWAFIDVNTWVRELAVDSQDTILLSSELIAWAADDVARAFCRVLQEWFEPKVVIYLRRQDNLIMAGYNQQVKAGTQLRELRGTLQHQLDRFDYDKRLAPWSGVLGDANIVVRPYERGQFFEGDIRKDFLHHVFGLPVDDRYRLERKNSNPRLCFSAMEYRRLLNNLITDTSQSTQFNEIPLKYSGMVDETSKTIFSAQALLSPKERQGILDISAHR